MRLVQAFFLSRVTCVTPFLDLKKDDEHKIDALIRRAYKQALGIPITASTERFEGLGLHNTLSELIKAQRLAQRERLTYSPTGRHILDSLAIAHPRTAPIKVALPSAIRESIHIQPIPKNMHPVHNPDRRQARATALHKQHEKPEDVVYVDAADYADCNVMVFVVVNRQGNSIASCSLRMTEPEVGEEAAIALAMTISTKIKYVVSDCKSAILNYARGRISPEASAILKSRFRNDGRTGKNYLIWAPAHSGLAGNECAHAAARSFTDRAGIDPKTTSAHLL